MNVKKIKNATMCKVGRRMEIVVLVVCINIERRGGGSFLAQKCAKCTKYYSGNHQKWFFHGKKYDSFFYVFMVVRSLRFAQRLDLRLDQRLHYIIDQNDLIQDLRLCLRLYLRLDLRLDSRLDLRLVSRHDLRLNVRLDCQLIMYRDLIGALRKLSDNS